MAQNDIGPLVTGTYIVQMFEPLLEYLEEQEASKPALMALRTHESGLSKFRKNFNGLKQLCEKEGPDA